LLAQEVVSKYPGKVKFVTENFGESKLAAEYGITRYPAVFVNDILLAQPRDFGFFGKEEKAGRYTPWLNPQSQARFKADLTHMVDLVVAGRSAEVSKQGTAGSGDDTIHQLPRFKTAELTGKPLNSDELAGRVTIVEFWATWCPPCLTTLHWLNDTSRKYADKVEVVALAVESPEESVKKLAASHSGGSIRWAMSTPETAQSFGDLVAVPTMYVFDGSGKTVKVFYGSPPEMHAETEKLLDSLMKTKQ
jgi:thiol-disulfide isomerase/thioredoxin